MSSAVPWVLLNDCMSTVTAALCFYSFSFSSSSPRSTNLVFGFQASINHLKNVTLGSI